MTGKIDNQTIDLQSALTSEINLVGLRVTVVDGPDKGKSQTFRTRFSLIGSGSESHFVLTDPAVSKNHLEVILEKEGFQLRDLGSKNGMLMGEMRLFLASSTGYVKLKLGNSLLAFEPTGNKIPIKLAAEETFGAVIGHSERMRELFSQLREVAKHPTAILLEGETGTGKELLAHAIHQHSSRAQSPYLILDCSTLTPTLAHRELFGHIKGAFTDAHASTPGIFSQAHGGTLFIDEVGELPTDIQAAFLRVLEYGEFTPVGANKMEKVDVRLVYATNRDLRRQVNSGLFRADLFHRISVVHLHVPPLRERLDDLPILTEHFLSTISKEAGNPLHSEEIKKLTASMLEKLQGYQWPGNVRELRNQAERFYLKYVYKGGAAANISISLDPQQETGGAGGDLLEACKQAVAKGKSFQETKQAIVGSFEGHFLRQLMLKAQGNVSEAARLAGIERRNFQKLLSKYGL